MVADAATATVARTRGADAVPLEQVERWVLRGGVFLLPLAYAPNTYDGYVLPKLLLARLILFALAALWLLRASRSHGFLVRRSALDLPILATLVSAALSTVFAQNFNVAVFGTYGRYDGLLTAITYAGLFWFALQTLESRADAVALLRTLLASGYVASLIAIVQSMRGSAAAGVLIPAYGTFGQKNLLGAFLVLLLPLAVYELTEARTWTGRIFALNALAVVAVALLLTFSRSAWIAGAVASFVLVIALARGRRFRVALFAVAAVAVVAAVAAWFGSGVALERADLLQLGDRPVVWSDTLRLIAARPLLGFGPDNFGLAFPSFQSVSLQQPWDKAHAEVLQIASTQGVVGVAAYLWLLVAFGVAFWRGGGHAAAWAVAAAFGAYEAALQVNFTALADALPFWIFLAAAMVILRARRDTGPVAVRRPRTLRAAAVAAALAGVVAAAPGFLADTQLRAAVLADFSGDGPGALSAARGATTLNPFQSVYATELGDVAFERHDWKAARDAYRSAAALGTFDPAVYRNLALADQYLGLFAEGRAAAAEAYRLDRFDPANRALLMDLGGTP